MKFDMLLELCEKRISECDEALENMGVDYRYTIIYQKTLAVKKAYSEIKAAIEKDLSC